MKNIKKIERTMSGLRDAVFETMEETLAGNQPVEVAKAVGGLAQVIINSVKVQMEYEKMRLESEVPANLPEMRLLPVK